MEIGNALFGHSRGRYEIDGTSRAADLLSDTLTELGVTGRGRVDDDNQEIIEPLIGVVLKETDRGVDVLNPQSGRLLMRLRAYWWGDDEDTVQAEAPNLEMPAVDVTVRWYKYWCRDAYANRPFTYELVQHMRQTLRPALTYAYPFTAHPLETSVDVQHVEDGRIVELPGDRFQPTLILQVHGESNPFDYDHGYVIEDERNGKHWKALILTRSNMMSTVAWFDTMEAAQAWGERRMRRWSRPEGAVK